MNKIFAITIGLAMWAILLFPGTVLAQNNVDLPGTQNGTYNQMQPGTIDNNSDLDATTNTQGARDNNNGFNWWWLLPLLAIPVIYLLTRKSDNRDDYRERSSTLSGAKGGSSERQDDEGRF